MTNGNTRQLADVGVLMTDSEITDLLYEVAIMSPENAGCTKIISEITGLAYRSVMNYMEGKVKPTLKIVKATFVATQDPRLRPLLEPRGYRLVPDPPPKTASVKEPEGEATDMMLAVAKVIDALRQDGVDSKSVLQTINRAIDDLDRGAVELRASVDKHIAPPPDLRVAGKT